MSSSSSVAGANNKIWKWNKDSADIAMNEHEMTGGYYDEILTQLRSRLASDHIRSHRHHRSILPTVGTTTAHNKWFDIRMHLDPSTIVHLRFLKEDFYLQGYRVNNGQWREFRADDKDTHTHKIDHHSQLLGYVGSYAKLRSRASLGTVGRDPLIQAALNLSTRPYDDDSVIARSLYVIVVMFCEAARFIPVQLFVQSNFFKPSLVPDWIDELVHRWGKLCGHVLYFHAHPKEKWPKPLTLKIDVNGHVKDVVVRTIDDVLEHLALIEKNPAKIHPYPELD